MSTKVQRNWGDICKELNARLKESSQDYSTLAKKAGVSYYAARRLALYGAINWTKNAEKLCEHFEIQLYENAKPQTGRLNELTALIHSVWDGSGAHADLLTRLITSTRPFKVQGRQNTRQNKGS